MKNPYRRQIALDLVGGVMGAEAAGAPRVAAAFRVGRDLVPMEVVHIHREGLRCVAATHFPPETFVVMVLDGRMAGMGTFDVTGLACTRGAEHHVRFHQTDIVARERLQALLLSLKHLDEVGAWSEDGSNRTKIMATPSTSTDELLHLKALVTQLAFERDEVRRELADERARHARTQAEFHSVLAAEAADAAWLPDAGESSVPNLGVSEVMLAALHDDFGEEGEAHEEAKAEAEKLATKAVAAWKSRQQQGHGELHAEGYMALDELPEEHALVYDAVRRDIEVTVPMWPRRERRSPFSSQESLS